MDKTTKTPLTPQPNRCKISNLPAAVKAWVWALVAATAVVAVPAVAAAVVVVGDSGAVIAEFSPQFNTIKTTGNGSRFFFRGTV